MQFSAVKNGSVLFVFETNNFNFAAVALERKLLNDLSILRVSANVEPCVVTHGVFAFFFSASLCDSFLIRASDWVKSASQRANALSRSVKM